MEEKVGSSDDIPREEAAGRETTFLEENELFAAEEEPENSSDSDSNRTQEPDFDELNSSLMGMIPGHTDSRRR